MNSEFHKGNRDSKNGGEGYKDSLCFHCGATETLSQVVTFMSCLPAVLSKLKTVAAWSLIRFFPGGREPVLLSNGEVVSMLKRQKRELKTP